MTRHLYYTLQPAIIDLNTAYKLVFVFDFENDETRTYVNGTLVWTSDLYGGGLTNMPNITRRLNVGREAKGNNADEDLDDYAYFDGKVKQLGIWSVAFTQDHVDAYGAL